MPRRKTQKEFMDDLNRVHKGTITTEDNYINSTTKVTFYCNTCKYAWKAIPRNVLHGAGCPKCRGGIKLTQEEFLNRLTKVWGTRITTSDMYINSGIKLEFHCAICGNAWKASPGHILGGRGCPLCANRNRAQAHTTTQEDFLNRLKEVHGNKISTNDTYYSEKKKMQFYCTMCRGFWKATPDKILQGRGCPNCASSSGEQTVSAILEFNNIDYDPQHNFEIKGKTHRLDFVLRDNNNNWCVIQPDGSQHTWLTMQFSGDKEKAEQSFKDRVARDRDENKYLMAQGVRVLRIPWFWFDLDNTFTLLQDFLGYKLEKPDKDYVPKYKKVAEMVHEYLKHGGVNNIAIKYRISKYKVLDNFKKYFGMTRKEYIKLHPEYSTSKIVSIDSSGITTN